MPTFLTQPQLYRVLQRELPSNVYPDGPPSAFFSTAENDSVAKVYASAYANMERIYDNQFPQHTSERINDWEITAFGKVNSTGLSLAERISRILTKLQQQRSLAMWEILTLIAGYIPEGKFVQIVEWGCGEGFGWKLGASRLGIDTVLSWGARSLLGDSDTPCEDIKNATGWKLGKSPLGSETRLTGSLTWQLISTVQAKAYTYEIRIFDYELPAADLEELKRQLDLSEPARSGRVIFQNLQLADYMLTVPLTEVGQFSGVNCITRDSASTTGYSGRKRING